MRTFRRKYLLVSAPLLLAIVTFFTGINWGLPSLDADRFLFRGRTPWTGAEIMKLAGSWDDGGNRGADIAMHPLAGRDRPIVLNDTDAKRAEIVRRFRLYSNQPDEMITFRSLARMKPGKLDLDPRLYQYGGLWIYPIGALLKLASHAGVVTLRSDLAFYLDYPAAFGRFYLLARGYSATWGLLGVVVVYLIGSEWTGTPLIATTAAAIFASLPVVINAAHEAKPHLPGTVLTLLTVWAGLRFASDGRARWWVLAAAFAGAAMGMVLTGYAAFAVLPVMCLYRPMPWKQRVSTTIFAGLIGVGVFVLTNPYLPYDYFFNRAALQSNVGNYGTFYRPGLSLVALVTSGKLLLEGLSLPVAVVGAIALVAMMVRCWSSVPIKSDKGGTPVLRRHGFILAAPACLVLIQFVLLAAGKAAEYARFAITLDVIIAIVAAAVIDLLPAKPREKAMLAILLVGATLFYGCRYDLNCVIDNRPDSSRRLAAAKIERMQSGASVLAVWSEPAPYCMPPVDLFAWKITLLPRGVKASDVSGKSGVVSVRPVDEAIPAGDDPPRAASPIGWANKPFDVQRSGD